jgi:endoglucanase
MKAKITLVTVLIISVLLNTGLIPQELKKEGLVLNKSEYFETRGINVLLFHNSYPDGKQGGIELIQHSVRIATNGDLRLEQLPQQWSAHPNFDKREVFPGDGKAVISLSFPNKKPSAGVFDPGLILSYKIQVIAEGISFRIIVDLEKPLPKEWVGKVGFQMEFYPAAYFGKTYRFEDNFGIFPRQPNGPVIDPGNNSPIAKALGEGHKLILSPEDPDCSVTIENSKGKLTLLDGRNSCQNGWFIVRTDIPAGATTSAVEWKIIPDYQPDWTRKPVIEVSELGYHPKQLKRAFLEMDTNDTVIQPMILQQLNADGTIKDVMVSKPEKWGKYLRYNYYTFDFSKITQEGLYRLKYNDISAGPFEISKNIFNENTWQPTLETFFPVQMCHMRVADNYRVWHGLCHMDDALQAPPSPRHFDQYVMDSATETRYKPFEHIPGLTAGGWHDAGDYDLPAGQMAIYFLALTQDEFKPTSDQTTIDQNNHIVELHRPDGKPDLLQQVEHGVLNLLSGYRASGHSFCGIIDSDLRQYAHLGDASTITDNYIYDPGLKPNEKNCGFSGKKDDRWAFTNKSSALEYRMATELALCGRVLKGYNDSLSKECINTASRIWNFEQSHTPQVHKSEYVPWVIEPEQINAAVELFLTTDSAKYKKFIVSNWPTIEKYFIFIGSPVSRVLNKIDDITFRHKFDSLVRNYSVKSLELTNKNPFHLPFMAQLWGSGDLYGYALRTYYLRKIYPDLFDKDNVYRVLNYIYGCHTVNNLPLVAGLGTKSKTISYGANRADWSYIPGGVCSGPSIILPDFSEYRDDFPFIWQQSEVTVGASSLYLFLVNSVNKLLEE